jgi:3-oxoacyl-[acyl-carrier protein] reductase
MTAAEQLDFSGKRVLVCGGSDGIGYGVAQMFSSAGAQVAITGTKEASEYPRDFASWSYFRVDLNQSESIEALASKFDRLDVLVNCVGSVLYQQGEFERSGFERIITINLTGAMHLYTMMLPLLQVSRGCIVSLDSVASIRPAWNNPGYSASKAGLVQLTKSLAKKWGKKGIRVNTVAPGLVPTKLTANQVTPDQEAAFAATCPVGRFGRPEDIAGAVLFLASPLASYITGEQIVVDGGASL